MKKRYNLVTLSTIECKGIETWLKAYKNCLDSAILDNTSGGVKSCKICEKVFGLNMNTDGGCPCHVFPQNFVIDVAITLLEHNGWELRNNLLTYHRVTGWY